MSRRMGVGGCVAGGLGEGPLQRLLFLAPPTPRLPLPPVLVKPLGVVVFHQGEGLCADLRPPHQLSLQPLYSRLSLCDTTPPIPHFRINICIRQRHHDHRRQHPLCLSIPGIICVLSGSQAAVGGKGRGRERTGGEGAGFCPGEAFKSCERLFFFFFFMGKFFQTGSMRPKAIFFYCC